MDIYTEVETREGYLYLSCAGDFGAAALLQVFEKAFSQAEDKEVPAVLIDARGIEGPVPSPMERFDLAKRLPEMQRRESVCIQMVLVGNKPFVSHDKFGETVAVNRGALGKVFTDIDEAVTWIEQLIRGRQRR